MEPDAGEWLTTKEAAHALGLAHATIRSQIMLGHLQAHLAHARKALVSRAEVERYRRESLGRCGWTTRQTPGHTPLTKAEAMRQYHARRRARAQQGRP